MGFRTEAHNKKMISGIGTRSVFGRSLASPVDLEFESDQNEVGLRHHVYLSLSSTCCPFCSMKCLVLWGMGTPSTVESGHPLEKFTVRPIHVASINVNQRPSEK